ncbi:hypothetical protein N656DRAFT_678377, partial [Canariomyces notabilis]
VDIIAIHGLGGHPFTTWTANTHESDRKGEKPTRLWLRDFLPKDLPSARIITYEYSSSPFSSHQDLGISEAAEKLLVALESLR